MPSFFSKIKGAFTSPSTPRKNAAPAASSPNAQNSIPKVYAVKEKELPKLHLAVWKGDLDKVTELCRPDKLNTFDKDGR
jgi:hypothetical protein